MPMSFCDLCYPYAYKFSVTWCTSFLHFLFFFLFSRYVRNCTPIVWHNFSFKLSIIYAMPIRLYFIDCTSVWLNSSSLWFIMFYILYAYCLIQVITRVFFALWYFSSIKLFTFSIISVMSLPLREPIVAFGSIAMHAIIVSTYFYFNMIIDALNMYAIAKGMKEISAFNKCTKQVEHYIFSCNNLLIICILVVSPYWLLVTETLFLMTETYLPCCWQVSWCYSVTILSIL